MTAPVTAPPRFTVQRAGPLRDLLPLKPAGSLGLEDAPVVLVRRPKQGGTENYLMLDTTLGRRRLMDLLFALAPYKAHGPDRFGRVLDNWGIFDRAKTGGGASSNLFMQHVKALGTHWRAFEQHRDLFMRVFEDQTEGTRIVPVVAWQTSPSGTRRLLADTADVESTLAASLSAENAAPKTLYFDTLVGLVTVPYLQPELIRRWPAWRPLVKGGKSNYIGPASVPIMALMHRRALLNSGLIRAVEALDDN